MIETFPRRSRYGIVHIRYPPEGVSLAAPNPLRIDLIATENAAHRYVADLLQRGAHTLGDLAEISGLPASALAMWLANVRRPMIKIVTLDAVLRMVRIMAADTRHACPRFAIDLLALEGAARRRVADLLYQDGYTHLALSEISGLSTSTFSMWLSGYRPMTKLSALRAMLSLIHELEQDKALARPRYASRIRNKHGRVAA